MFLARKLLAAALMPFSLVLGLLLLGLILLWFTRKQRFGKVILSVGTFLLLLCSLNFISDLALIPLESRYPPLNLESLKTRERDKAIKWVVVLGGGHVADARLSELTQLSGASLVRLAEGIRIYRALPGAKLLLSGGIIFDRTPEAETMAAGARALGVSPAEVILEADSPDTETQARLIQARVGTDDFILVTSAAHLPRAMALFEKRGMHPIPAPVGHMVKTRQAFGPGLFIPNLGAVSKLQTAWYEYLGMLWAKLRGKI